MDWLKCLTTDWTRRLTPDGLILYRREGRAAGAIVIRERVRPQVRLRDLVAQACGRAGTESHVGPVQRITTSEGEHAAMVEIARQGQGERSILLIGVVYGDDFMATVHGTTSRADCHDSYREVVEYTLENFPLGAGSQRRRRFEYTPPSGWHGVARAHSVSWYAPEYPLDQSVIRIFDARPAAQGTAQVVCKSLFEDPQEKLVVRDSATTPYRVGHALTGSYDVVHGTAPDGMPATVFIVTLLGDAYLYNLRLETSEPHASRSRVLFDQLVQTVVPLPSANPVARVAAVSQWAD